jgi:predicted metal-dependent HD superfamily phosphohydrolase
MTEILPAMENEDLIDSALKDALRAFYAADDRHYHGLAHIEALLVLAHEYRSLLADPKAVETAAWFHDAIYDSRAKDNEAKSAQLARDWLTGRAAPERIQRIASMIEATATHTVPDLADLGARNDAALFLDMDLSILGAAPDTFDAYERAVRREYGWVDEAAWRTGRAAVLKTFLARPHIFHTQPFRERFEMQARENMQQSIAKLSTAEQVRKPRL